LTLVEPPRDVNVIGTKWVFKNKHGEDGEVVRNNARLVAQGFSQMEGLDFVETFAPIAHLETIRILLAFVASKGFKLYQMDVKSAYLNCVRKKSLLGNPQVLRTPSILIECTNFQKLCTGLSKLQGHGILGLKLSC
jgi:hypothetical protein